METSYNELTAEIAPAFSGEESLQETEIKNSECDNLPASKKRRRIVYGRDFLFECFQHPSAIRKPPKFPTNLPCALNNARWTKFPTNPFDSQLKRTNDIANTSKKMEKNSDDLINLRPQSGNFSSGCAPNLTQSQLPPPSSNNNSNSTSNNNISSRFRIHDDKMVKNAYDRDSYTRGNFRNNNNRGDLSERNRLDRDRERDIRDRNSRPNLQSNRRSNHNSHNWGENESDWNRNRRTNRHYGDRYYEEKEPEWFSEGPTTQLETIELRGFLEDDRRPNDEFNYNRHSQENNAVEENQEEPTFENTNINSEETEENNIKFNLDKILNLDNIPGVPNLFKDEEPSGMSRFCRFFQKEAAPNSNKDEKLDVKNVIMNNEESCSNLNNLIQLENEACSKPIDDSTNKNTNSFSLLEAFDNNLNNPDKLKKAQELQNVLKDLLLKSEEKERDSYKEEKPENVSDLNNAFKKLLGQFIPKPTENAEEALSRQLTVIQGNNNQQHNNMQPPAQHIQHAVEMEFNHQNIQQIRRRVDLLPHNMPPIMPLQNNHPNLPVQNNQHQQEMIGNMHHHVHPPPPPRGMIPNMMHPHRMPLPMIPMMPMPFRGLMMPQHPAAPGPLPSQYQNRINMGHSLAQQLRIHNGPLVHPPPPHHQPPNIAIPLNCNPEEIPREQQKPSSFSFTPTSVLRKQTK